MGNRIICGECQGSGVAECPIEYGGRHPESCPACGGDGKVVCPACDGCGYVDEDTGEPMPDDD